MYDDGTLSGVRRPMYFLIPPRNSRAFRLKYKLSYTARGEAPNIADNATFVIVGNGESKRAGGPKLSNNPRLFACSISVCGTPSRQSNNRLIYTPPKPSTDFTDYLRNLWMDLL